MSFATYPSLKDAVVYVTGGASGIGAEIIRAFAGQPLQPREHFPFWERYFEAAGIRNIDVEKVR